MTAEEKAYHAAYYRKHKQRITKRERLRSASVEAKAEKAAYYLTHRKEIRKRQKGYGAKNAMNRYYQRVYGISQAEFEAQIEKQHGLCPIGNHPFGPRGNHGSSPHQDHDHETGKNRDVLCSSHNTGLGRFHDSVGELQAAIEYLKKHRGEEPCQK